MSPRSRSEAHEDSEIITFQFLNFVLFDNLRRELSVSVLVAASAGSCQNEVELIMKKLGDILPVIGSPGHLSYAVSWRHNFAFSDKTLGDSHRQ